MKIRPIIFTNHVPEIPAGSKTQTRRVIVPQPLHWSDVKREPYSRDDQLGIWSPLSDNSENRKCRYGVVGDRLWVKEAYRGRAFQGQPMRYTYRADFPADNPAQRWEWWNAMFMPREASRLVLEITELRAQRLQEISEEDARAEGIVEPQPAHGAWCDPAKGREGHWSYRKPFCGLWDSINAKRAPKGAFAWDNNPWVWAITFRLVLQ
jgi:hypothetical protein